jgi:hypothetical protein
VDKPRGSRRRTCPRRIRCRANNGVFIVLTADAGEDLPVPGERFSFGVLEMAQAIGDFQSLDRTSRRALHLHLPQRDPFLLRRVMGALVNGR